jgi:hypothetical protein
VSVELNVPHDDEGVETAVPPKGVPLQAIGSHWYNCPVAGFVAMLVVSKVLDGVGEVPELFNE